MLLLRLLSLQLVDLLLLRGVLVTPSLDSLAYVVGSSAYDGSAQKKWHALLLGPCDLAVAVARAPLDA